MNRSFGTAWALTCLYLGTVSLACGSDTSDRLFPDRAFVIARVFARGDYLYASGNFRSDRNQAGNRLLGHNVILVLDAHDPMLPKPVATLDVVITRAVALMSGKLVAIQSGYDETRLDETPPPQANARVKIYNLDDPKKPTLESEVEFPGTGGFELNTGESLDDTTLVVSAGAGVTEPSPSPLTFIVKPFAAAGGQITGTADVPCRAPVLIGPDLHCFDALGRPSGRITRFSLTPAGALTQLGRGMDDALISPVRATAIGADVIAVADLQAAPRLYSVGTTGIATFLRTVDPGGPVRTAIGLPTGELITLTSSSVLLLGPIAADLPTISTLANPAGSGTGDVRSLDDAVGLFGVAMGDQGLLIIRKNGAALEKVGGYYRWWNDDPLLPNGLREGNY